MKTIEHLKKLYKITREEGIAPAIKYDLSRTARDSKILYYLPPASLESVIVGMVLFARGLSEEPLTESEERDVQRTFLDNNKHLMALLES
jgi:hypothetical protein